LISSIATVAAAGERLRTSQVVINPDPKLSHAANLIYMITGKRPTPVEGADYGYCLYFACRPWN